MWSGLNYGHEKDNLYTQLTNALESIKCLHVLWIRARMSWKRFGNVSNFIVAAVFFRFSL